ncbi:maternal protein exuperantia [Teleopsis dalmanni]|uniref:maternal protein exuperantia n=1 Tax=Teleopsis dalmanni TaxID=139649 RepID=UPI0018CF58DD|nr:maternal protein exuperantia [Teleopsis dalmanni]
MVHANIGDSPATQVAPSAGSDDILISSTKILPSGKYTLVGIDIDTTGRRLIDEIVQLAAYTPQDHFEQYIMPYMNLNPAARQRHQVRVISIGFYRMLKSMQTYKIIKSKSEIAALKDFLDWLELIKTKDSNSLGVILVYHEERKFIPYMILESLKKYNLLDRFLNTVKSFTNGLCLTQLKENESLQRYSLRKLSRVLSSKIQDATQAKEINSSTDSQKSQKLTERRERDLFDGNASVRAKLALEVALQLSNQNTNESIDSVKAMDNLLIALHPYAQPIDFDLSELKRENENLERQNSFRPVFLHYFKTTLYHRVRAVKFRIILAAQGYTLNALNEVWSEKKKDGLVAALEKITELKSEDKKELADLFDSFYDPTKTTIKPVIQSKNLTINRRRNKRNGGTVRSSKPESIISEQGGGGDKASNSNIPEVDSTTKPSSLVNNEIKAQRRRPTRTRRSSIKKNAPPGVAVTTAMPITAST